MTMIRATPVIKDSKLTAFTLSGSVCWTTVRLDFIPAEEFKAIPSFHYFTLFYPLENLLLPLLFCHLCKTCLVFFITHQIFIITIIKFFLAESWAVGLTRFRVGNLTCHNTVHKYLYRQNLNRMCIECALKQTTNHYSYSPLGYDTA